MKFCCDKFKGLHEVAGHSAIESLGRELYPNIAIVKLPPDQHNNGARLYRYLFVCGFMKDKPPVVNMKHCPFCGTHLFAYYRDDAYVNGDSQVFFG